MIFGVVHEGETFHHEECGREKLVFTALASAKLWLHKAGNYP